jgi:hypothetical protein
VVHRQIDWERMGKENIKSIDHPQNHSRSTLPPLPPLPTPSTHSINNSAAFQSVNADDPTNKSVVKKPERE